MTWIRDALSGEINKADETGGNGSAEVRADETSRCSLAGDAVRADRIVCETAPAGFCFAAVQPQRLCNCNWSCLWWLLFLGVC